MNPKRILLLSILLLATCGVAQAATMTVGPTAIAPGVTNTLTIDPSSGTAPLTVTRTATLTNTNLDVGSTTTTYPLGCVVRLQSDPTHPTTFNGPTTVTAPGVPGARSVVLDWTLPAGATFVAGSLRINGVLQPEPALEANGYGLILTIPAQVGTTAGKITVQDQVRIPLVP
jgi:hypothetical protein